MAALWQVTFLKNITIQEEFLISCQKESLDYLIATSRVSLWFSSSDKEESNDTRGLTEKYQNIKKVH